MTIPDLDRIIADHKYIWWRQAKLIIVNAVCASLVLGAFIGGWIVTIWGEL